PKPGRLARRKGSRPPVARASPSTAPWARPPERWAALGEEDPLGARRLDEERDEVGKLLVAELVAVRRRHDPCGEAARDHRVGIHDRLVYERGVLALEDVVEVR